MKKTIASALAAILTTLVLATLDVSPARAQTPPAEEACLPGTPSDYPATGGSVAIDADLTLTGGTLVPSTSGSLSFTGGPANAILCGTVFSDPVTLTNTRVSSTGAVTFRVAVPADFELNAPHHADVYRAKTRIGSFDFCVDGSGNVKDLKTCRQTTAAKSQSKGLAKTGADRALELARIGVVLLAVGGGVLYLRRRRTASS